MDAYTRMQREFYEKEGARITKLMKNNLERLNNCTFNMHDLTRGINGDHFLMLACIDDLITYRYIEVVSMNGSRHEWIYRKCNNIRRTANGRLKNIH